MAHFDRGSGVLLHPSALPGPYGIGCLGVQALAFLDWLHDAGQSYWQICPLVPTGFGDSPYQGFSAFAGNPNLIDLENLIEWKLLEAQELNSLKKLPSERVDFSRLIPAKNQILKVAWNRFNQLGSTHPYWKAFKRFRDDASDWLTDYSLFMVIKERHGGISWKDWEKPLRFREPSALKSVHDESKDALGYHEFVQFVFSRQWTRVKNEAGKRGIRIIGDLPIFVSYDSSDCWAHPELFLLDSERRPTHVAGVPPDYFSETGQLWGNPLYNWKTMKSTGYQWWIDVLKDKLNKYALLRIDHFRGFSAFWCVPYGETTAVNGRWVDAPGVDLFAQVQKALGDIPVIAEDLGVITEDVVELIQGCGFPRMKVLQFAFDSAEQNDYLPHTFEKHCVVYTGTHDNDTAAGWYAKAHESDREAARDYLNLPPDVSAKKVAEALFRAAMASVGDLAITPLQDILGCGSETRFNTPGTLSERNWSWRADESTMNKELAAFMRKLCTIYGRLTAD